MVVLKLLVLCMCVCLCVGQTTWYVDSTAASGGDGTKDSPYQTFFDAYNAASTGDTILAAADTTYSGDKNKGLELKMDGIAEITFGVNGDGDVTIDLGPGTQAPFIAATAPDTEMNSTTSLTINGYIFMNNPHGYVLKIDTAFYVELSDCEFYDNGVNAPSDSITHAIFLQNSIAFISHCTFENNYSPFYGAAALFNQSKGLIFQCNFINNSVPITDIVPADNDDIGSGGALFVVGTYLGSLPIIRNSTFTGNSGSSGGAIRLIEGTESGNFNPLHFSFVLSACMFDNNTAEYYGGAVSTVSLVEVDDSEFTHNKAGFGGALALVGGSNLISSSYLRTCSFGYNTASDSGGAVYQESVCSLIVKETLFDDNTALTGSGGAVYILTLNVQITFQICYFSENTAPGGYGGAIATGNNTLISLSDKNWFDRNSCLNDGGAIFLPQHASLTCGGQPLSFTHNHAGGNGGAIRAEFNSVITNAAFSQNSAASGGAISLHGDVRYSQVSKSSFLANTGENSGGAIEIYTDNFLDRNKV